VIVGDEPQRRREPFRVDRHGILRHEPVRRRRGSAFQHLPEPRSALEAWLAARRVGERDTHLYWFVLTPAGAFRQHRARSDADVARWSALPQWFRDEFVLLAEQLDPGAE
jgi:hypothetical protein